jgi:chorismate mutase / prephenate dehydrogenase
MDSVDSSEELRELRAELDEVDRQWIRAIAARMRIVAKIKSAKESTGRPVFDRQREREVMSRVEREAELAGLDPDLADTVTGALLSASHRLQGARSTGPTPGVQAQILVVGGGGEMGQLFGKILGSRGHTIDVLEKDEGFSAQRIRRADIVMIAVPMAIASRVASEIAPHVRPDALLCDINSLKSSICEEMGRGSSEVLGTHPMFGPTVQSLRRQKIIYCPVRSGPRTEWFLSELGSLGADMLESDAETHDRMMANVQVLTHFGIIALGQAFAESGVSLRETIPFMSPIYRLELSMVGRLFSQDPALYREILRTNPNGPALHQLFADKAAGLAADLATPEAEEFMTAFTKTSDYFREFSREAMELSDHIIETLMSRP